jgi:hypothetical protein
MKTGEQKTGRTLEQVAKDIQQWRQTRPKPRAMPGALWEDITALARAVGVYRVSKALGLNYSAVQERISADARGERRARRRVGGPAKKAGGDFIELHPAALPSNALAEGAVEVVAPDGARLILRLKGHSPMDIATLVSAFRQGRA